MEWKYLAPNLHLPLVIPHAEPEFIPNQPHHSINVPNNAFVGELIWWTESFEKRFLLGFKYIVAIKPIMPPTMCTWNISLLNVNEGADFSILILRFFQKPMKMEWNKMEKLFLENKSNKLLANASKYFTSNNKNMNRWAPSKVNNS